MEKKIWKDIGTGWVYAVNVWLHLDVDKNGTAEKSLLCY